MIIDFVGAPAVGKSTFARALADRLLDCGCPVNVVASYRPAEGIHIHGSSPANATPGQIAAALRRITRPATELIANTGDFLVKTREPAIAKELMTLLPPRSLIWSVRLHQYLIRLAHSWRLASGADQIALFDQGFVQAVCSLVVLGRAADRQNISRALALVPMPDFLVHLTAPVDVLATRLRERERRQGKLERLFELDLPANLSFVSVIAELDLLLESWKCRVVSVDCADQESLLKEVERVATDVITVFNQTVSYRHD
jgi:thymidylate kinase